MAGTRERRRVGRELHTAFVLIEGSRERPLERGIREQKAAFSVDDHSRVLPNERSKQPRSGPQRSATFLVRETLELAKRA